MSSQRLPQHMEVYHMAAGTLEAAAAGKSPLGVVSAPWLFCENKPDGHQYLWELMTVICV